MSLFVLLSASVVVPLYSNIKRAPPFLSKAQKTGADAPSSTSCLRLVSRYTANRRNYNRQRPQCGLLPERRRDPKRNAKRCTSPASQDGSNHKTNHYKQPFAFVPLVAVLLVVRPQCGRTSPKEAPRSTASKGCSPLVRRSGE